MADGRREVMTPTTLRKDLLPTDEDFKIQCYVDNGNGTFIDVVLATDCLQ